MRSVNITIGMLLASFSGLLHAQEINFTALPGAATPGLGELVYDASSDRLYIASGAGEIRVIDRNGTLDSAFAGDGIIGNDVGESVLLDAEYLAISGNLILAVDQEQRHIQVINASTGALDLSIGTDGIIGNDAAEPDFSSVNLHDIEIHDNQLYIATNNNVILYALDGSNSNSEFSSFPAQTLHFGPLSSSGNCSDNAFANDQLLYAVTPNDLNGAQGTVACLDSNGMAETLAQTGDISLTDLVFAPSAGDSCVNQLRFANGTIAYLASRRVDTELRCMGSDGGSATANDASIGASTGITVADNALYIREVGLVGTIYRSDALNQIPVIAAQSITLDENTTTPVLITTATATDGDTGAMLGDWMIMSGNDSVDGDADPPFVIDSNTGDISLNDPGDLDRELAAGFDLMVTVSDGISTSGPASILISLNDLNEFDPQVDAFANLAFDENPATASLIVTATGSDLDATAILQNWTIVTGNTSVDGDMDPPFSIDPNNGQITVNDAADLDRELTALFTLGITVSDGEVTSSTVPLMIALNDVNEFVPQAVNQTLSVDENPALSAVITVATATDDDATTVLGNWTITSGNISVDGDANLPFAIDPVSGQITVTDSGDFDRELIAGFSLSVTVSDETFTSAAATIIVNLDDINKFTPVIGAIAPFAIDENQAQGSTLLVATASDDDATAVLQDWTIISGNLNPDGDANLAFAIDPDSGVITFNDAEDFDRELVDVFTLSLTVSDGENLSDMVDVTISVNDVNEFDPVIDAVPAVLLNKGDADGTPVITVTAVDEDATSALLDWRIVSGNIDLDQDGNLPFVIDSVSGLISVNDNGDFDIKQIGSFDLAVTVSDSSRTSAEQIITIQLVADTSLVIAANDSFSLTEGDTLSIPSPGVLANDEDENGNDLVVDELNGLGGLGANTVINLGLIVSLSSDGTLQLDASNVTEVAEGQSPEVTFSYRASNGSDTDIATVTVSILGRNDSPVAQDDLFALLEDQMLDASVFDDNGNGVDSDPDQGQSIQVQNPELITLTGMAGTLTVSANGQFQFRPAADTNGTAMFDYTLTDGSETSTASVVIDVTAVNDPPMFTAGSNQFVSAGTTGMQVIPIWANDISAGANEGGQMLEFTVTPTSDPDGVVSAISVSSDGVLEYTLSGNQGLARFDVLLMDDGGTEDGGVDQSDTVELIVSNQNGVELVSSIDDGRPTVEDGESLIYVIVHRNDGPDDALGAGVTALFPSELINISWTCSADVGATCGPTGIGDIDETVDIPVGTTVTFTVDATVSAASGVISTTVTAMPATAADEILPENNSATDTTIIGEELFSDGFEDLM